MPINLDAFGLPKRSQNVLDVKSTMQSSLPQPADNIIADLISKVTGPNTPSVLTTKDQTLLRAGSASTQIDAKKAQDKAMWTNIAQTGVKLVEFLQDKGKSSGYVYGGVTELKGMPSPVTPANLTKKTSAAAIQPPNYGLPRMSWQLTTDLRMMREETPIYFYVNSDTVSYGFDFIEAIDLVQKGYFVTQWRNLDDETYFPGIKVNFNLQTSNILPETYAKSTAPYITDKNVIDTYGAENLNRSIPSLKVPPGLQNFYDLMGLLNEPKMIDVRSMVEDKTLDNYETYASYDGKPNLVYLSISTRVFPKLTLKGYFIGSLQPSEDAQNPLSMKFPLQFLAVDSDPHWWDAEEMQQTYENFYSSSAEMMMSITDLSQPYAKANTAISTETLESIKIRKPINPEDIV